MRRALLLLAVALAAATLVVASGELRARDVRALLTHKQRVALELQTAAAAGERAAAQRLQLLGELELAAMQALAALGRAVADNSSTADTMDPSGQRAELRLRLHTAQLAALEAELAYQELVALSSDSSSSSSGGGSSSNSSDSRSSDNNSDSNDNSGGGTGSSTAKEDVEGRDDGAVEAGVRNAADQLERGLAEHTFDRVAHDPKGVTIETVLRVDDDDDDDDEAAEASGEDEDVGAGADATWINHAGDDGANANDANATTATTTTAAGVRPKTKPKRAKAKAKAGGVSFLVDPEDNVYVLAKPKDPTVPYEDVRLLFDVVRVVVGAFVGGWAVAAVAGLPAVFGYILAGVVLGPAGLNLITSLVQVETVAQLGIVLVLFVLGIDFSFHHLHGVWPVAVYGAALLIVLVAAVVAAADHLLLARSLAEGIAVGICVALSSTAVVVGGLTPHDRDSPEGRAMVGVLVLQDMYLGVLLGILPVVSHLHGTRIAAVVGRLGLATAVFLFLAYAGARLMGGVFLRLVRAAHNPGVTVLGMLAHCFLMMSLADVLGLSIEFGCFVAGLQASARPAYVDIGLPLLAPVRDVFAALFFAAIGLHIYPVFVYHQLPLLLALTAAVVLTKLAIGWLLLRGLFGYRPVAAAQIALGLSQVSEFAFVVAARSKALGLVSREVYYLILATTALSLLTTPILWKVLPATSHSHDSGPLQWWRRRASISSAAVDATGAHLI